MRRTAFARWMLLAPLAGAAILVIGACGTGSPTPTPTQTSAAGSPAPGSASGLQSPGGFSGGANMMSVDALKAAMSLGASGGNGASQQAGIWVQGSGSVTTKPDIGVLSFGVEVRGDTVANARTQAAQAMDAALKALRSRGIDDKDIQTQFFNIQPIVVYRDTGVRGGPQTPEIVGYMVNNSATVKVRKIADLGDVIDDVAKAGGNAIRINQVGFSVEDPKPLEAKARDLAVKDAVAKAQQMAQAAGVKVGPALFISESGGSPVMAREAMSMAPGLKGADVSTPISTGESQVIISVQMVFPIR